MVGPRRHSRLVTLTGGVGVFMAVLVALYLRLLDPLSSPILPMEDPWRHMGLIREHLRMGTVGEPGPEDMALYPPGLHAFMAALWVFTGAELYEIFRFAPVGLGVIGVLGMGVLLWRHLGPLPAFVGAAGYAVAPGVVLFTTAMQPTALDLAMLPFLSYAVVEVSSGRLRWTAVVVPFALFFMLAHPWFLGLLALVAFVFAALCVLVNGLLMRPAPGLLSGPAVLLAVFGGTLGLTMTSLGGLTYSMDPLFPSFMHHDWMPWAVMAASMVPLLVVLFGSKVVHGLVSLRRAPLSIKTRLLTSSVILAGFLGVTLPALHLGLPEDVVWGKVSGWPLFVLGVIGATILPLIPGRRGLFALSFAVVVYPLTLYEVYALEWLPYRLSIFLVFAMVVLAAVAVAGMVRMAGRFLVTMSQKTTGSGRSEGPVADRFMAVALVPVFFVGVPLGGAVFLATPPSEGWYRIIDECEMEAFRETAWMMEREPDAVLLTGNWQSWLVMTALTNDAENLRIGHWWMRDYEWHHQEWLQEQAEKNAPLYLLIDPHTHDEVKDLGFLVEDPWRVHAAWCPGNPGGYRVTMYTSGPIDEVWELEPEKESVEAQTH